MQILATNCISFPLATFLGTALQRHNWDNMGHRRAAKGWHCTALRATTETMLTMPFLCSHRRLSHINKKLCRLTHRSSHSTAPSRMLLWCRPAVPTATALPHLPGRHCTRITSPPGRCTTRLHQKTGPVEDHTFDPELLIIRLFNPSHSCKRLVPSSPNNLTISQPWSPPTAGPTPCARTFHLLFSKPAKCRNPWQCSPCG